MISAMALSAKSVIHGEDAILGEFPWAALLGTEKTFENWDNRRKIWTNKTETLYQCGGTLINTWYVLTAAHCQTENTKIVEVVLGEWDVFSDPDCPRDEDECDNPKAQRRKVAEVISHSGYDKKAGPNDIALIRMKTEVRLNRFVQLACLPLPEYNLPVYFYSPVFLNATLVGWGQTSNKEPTNKDLIYLGLKTNKLQKGNMPIQPLEQCMKAYPRKEIQSSQLCAGADKLNSKTGSCKGDSGGGLFVDSGEHSGQSSGNRHVQVGLVSYGAQLCGDYPAVYTRVDQFIPWIKDIIGF